MSKLDEAYERALAAAKPVPEWKTTPELISRTKRDWGRVGTFAEEVEWMPMRLRKVLWIDFSDPESASDSDKKNVASLAKAMRQRVPLPPAVGYYDSHGYLVIHDGNHRLTAARRARIKTFPVLIYKPNFRT